MSCDPRAGSTGQDLDEGEDGVFRIARRVSKDRVISTVDPDACHGHMPSTRGFDGYKGHVAVDPDSELIVQTAVTAGNAGDASAADELLADDLARSDRQPDAESEPEPAREPSDEPLSVYGDSAYGAGELLSKLEDADAEVNCEAQLATAAGGRFTKDEFGIDLDAGCTHDMISSSGVRVPCGG